MPTSRGRYANVRRAQSSMMPPAHILVPWPETGRKWYRVHIDYAGPVKGHMLLVVVDAETKWLEAISMQSTTSESTMEAKGQYLPCLTNICLFDTLVSDNWPQFVSAEFKKFIKMKGINHVTTATYHPQSNGLAECAVRTIKEGLRKAQGDSHFNCLYRFFIPLPTDTYQGWEVSVIIYGRREWET